MLLIERISRKQQLKSDISDRENEVLDREKLNTELQAKVESLKLYLREHETESASLSNLSTLKNISHS